MKTKIEVNGFDIEIEETEGTKVDIKITRDGEEVEQLTLDSNEYVQGQKEEEMEEEDGVKSFDEFEASEEKDLGEEAQDNPQEEEEAQEDEEVMEALTFSQFITKNKL